jgi:hypothetical protein
MCHDYHGFKWTKKKISNLLWQNITFDALCGFFYCISTMCKGIGSNLKVQLIKMWDSHVRGLNFLFLFSLFLFIFFMFFYLFLTFSMLFCVFYYKNTMDECRHKILVVLFFYYGQPSSHCTSGLIATNSYYTTLEYDECIVFFKVFGHATTSLEHIHGGMRR